MTLSSTSEPPSMEPKLGHMRLYLITIRSYGHPGRKITMTFSVLQMSRDSE